jgi:hypothetical protein
VIAVRKVMITLAAVAIVVAAFSIEPFSVTSRDGS